MDILISVAGKIAEYTVVPIVAPIGRQAGYLLFYKDNFNTVKDQVKELERMKERVEHDIEEEKRNGNEIEADVLSWQNTVSDTLEKAKRLCEDPRHAVVGCSRWSFPNLKSRHQLSRNAKKMVDNIVEVKGKGKFERLGYYRPLDVVNLIATTRGSEKLDSRNLIKKDIVLSLRDPKISKIGVYGLGGVGKTSLAYEVAKKVKDDNLFDVVVMVKISQTSNVEIQNMIADQLGLYFKESSTFGRAIRLCERIKEQKTMLIIMDDIWEKIDLEKLGIPSIDIRDKINLEKSEIPSKGNNEGCKLLLISRNQDILLKNETQKNFKLDVLDDMETWSLFKDMVGDAVKDANVQTIATQVAQRCAGLPVLIVTIAKSLKDKNIFHWKDALTKLESADRDLLKMIYSALEFNYNQLEDDEAKEIFLLCGVHGTSILFSNLLKYVFGLGVLSHINTIEDARNRLYRIIDDLKASSLVLDDVASAKEIKMHDFACEVATFIASRDQYVLTWKRNDMLQDWPSGDFLKRCSQIILNCCIQKLPQKLVCPNLKFFHLNSTNNPTLEIPHSFFEGMGNLEALDLIGVIILSLPSSLASLIKLKTLCLDYCSLKDMVGIGALIKLEILSFIHSSMEEFPSEIAQLTHLRMLDLSASKIEVFPANIVSKLTKLEDLYMGKTSIKWGEESSTKQNKNASVAELRYLTSLTTLKIQIHEAWMLPRDILFEKLERYKIIIGDKWERSNNNGTTRLLKLKLDTSIRLEHGIKALINKVEDLYLDEINGVSNVLFQLNGEGFPLLRHLQIQNNGEILHIVNSMKRNQSHVLFPELETLILHNLKNLVKICHGPLTANSFGKLTIIKVKSCDQLVYLFSVLMVKALSQLLEIEVSECNSMTSIVIIESADSGLISDDKIEFSPLRSMTLQRLPAIDNFCAHKLSSTTEKQNLQRTNFPSSFFNAKVKFSNLETLKLSSINLKEIWDDDHLFAAYSINNLANLTVHGCSGLKYLFPPSMLGSLLNLKQLEISKCDMMEDLIAGRNSVALEEVLFPKFETIIIKGMQNLKTIWHPFLTPNSMGSLKTLKVKSCEKVENIFPAYMHRAFVSLETLKVSDCDSVKEIFQFGVNDVYSGEDTTQLKNITLLQLPKLKQIWSKDPQSSLRFYNLQVVRVENCKDLEYLFPFSIAMELFQLEQINIKYSGRMKEIVSEKEGHMESHVKFQFHHLTSLQLWSSYELRGFYAGNYSLSCPSLTELDVRDCLKLKLFKRQGTSAQGSIFGSNLQVSEQQPLFMLEEVISNLERLTLNEVNAKIILQGQYLGEQFCKLQYLVLENFEDEKASFPYWFLQNITDLPGLLVEFSSFKEIFQENRIMDEDGKIETRTRLKNLILNQLHELQHICKEGVQIDPALEILEYLHVVQCSNLKHLVPSSVTFSCMTYLVVQNCSGLIDLITSSTARSLVKLTTLTIRECNSVEQIVAEEGGESKEEIAFTSLEVLELECLPTLKLFCSSSCFLKLPLLEKLVIRQCPRMKSFSKRETSAPMLQKILTDEENEKWCWEGDLNKTIDKMFQDMVAFNSFNYLELLEYPELKVLWYGQVEQKIFCNLKHLVVHKCTFPSNIIFSSNLLQLLHTLEELEVAECESLEAVFDVKVSDDKELHSKEVSELKKLILSNLPNLKHIWKEEPQQTLSFENLQVVNIAKCPDLKTLFWASLCQDLRQLEEINIEYCGVEEIVAIEEGFEELKFYFPKLEKLRLANLMQLTNFYPKRYTLECPSLKILNVGRCEALQVFALSHLEFQQLRVGDDDLPIHQPLFYIKKVSQNLEDLSINEKDAMRILKGNTEANVFQGIEMLRLQSFQETPMMFLNVLLERFPSTTKLVVRYSSFETLFLFEEIGHCSIKGPSQIKTLWLFQIEKLKHIWNDGSVSDLLVQNLEDLSIWECSQLRRLAPPAISFINLTTLKVEDCNGLIYLVTSFTAKSLIHLTWLTVKNCGMLEEVVITDERESEEEITFKSLKDMELTYLSSFKSFCCGKHTFVFPSLVTLKVTGCYRMQTFSSGVIIAPFLKIVEVENKKKRWKEDLNTTIRQLFMAKAIGGGDEGNYKESSSNIAENSQKHQRTVNSDEASSSKAVQNVDTGEQEIHKLPIQRTATRTRDMHETVQSLLVEDVKTSQSPVTNADVLDEAQDMEILPGENLLVQTRTFIIDDNKETIGAREMHEAINRPLTPTDHDAGSLATTQNTEESNFLNIRPSGDLFKRTTTSAIVDNKEKLHDPETCPCENLSTQITSSVIADKRERMHETIDRALVQAAQNTLNPAIAQGADIWTQEMSETIKKALIQAAQNLVSSTMVHNTEKSHDPKKVLGENKLGQLAETRAIIDPSHSQAPEPTISSIQDAGADKRLIVHPAQDVLSPTTFQNIGSNTSGKSHDLENVLGENLSNQTIESVIAENRATLDPTPSQSLEAMSSSTTLVADAYNSFKEMMDNSGQFMPYLEVGVKRHPQVLNWFNTKQRRVFAFLFAEVTHILRTTRRCDLTEDDRNYIKECCTALEAVGFDAGWLSYVCGCVEECGDGEDLQRKLEEEEGKAVTLQAELEEVESKASSLKKELASVQVSLALLRDKASKLYSFIET